MATMVPQFIEVPRAFKVPKAIDAMEVPMVLKSLEVLRSLRSQGGVEELQQFGAILVPLFVLLGLLHLHFDLFP